MRHIIVHVGSDSRAMAIGRSIGGVLGICLGAYMIASTLPGALTAINEANTSGWTASQAALWPVVGIIVMFAAIATTLPEV